MKLKYKGKTVKIVNSKDCENCIFYDSRDEWCFTEKANPFEERNKIKCCTISLVKYIYTN